MYPNVISFRAPIDKPTTRQHSSFPIDRLASDDNLLNCYFRTANGTSLLRNQFLID